MPPAWTPFDPRSRFGPVAYRYFVILSVAGLMFWLASNLIRSRVGRAIVAMRNNPIGASVCGVPLARYKTAVFGLSAAFAGVAGALLMIQNPQATDTRFDLFLAVFLLVALFAGGTTTMAGAVPGGLIHVFLPYYAIQWVKYVPFLGNRPGAGAISSVLYGAVLLVFVFFLPGGVGEGVRRVWRRIVEIEPNPAWLVQAADGDGKSKGPTR